MLLAEASNEFTGQWILVGIAVLGAIGILLAILAYFATRRDVDELSVDIRTLTTTLARQNEINEKRSAVLHDRLNVLDVDVGELKGSTRAFENSFEKFTRIIESTSRANQETIKAFTQSLLCRSTCTCPR